ncbi:SIMPL domain-containing protein [Microbacterium sp. RD1]|uniref:SIMPL domain-containing protein n=1 Tax=Microbacterium sp. RD1 TaxID=3457313 RepID=UPI003FA5E3A1
MSEVIVTVRGEKERSVAPERAVLQLAVRADGPERGRVVERVTGRAEPLRDDLIAHQRSGEVIEWSSNRVSVWSERPWNSEGRQLPPVHHASIEISATFGDFAALSWWVGESADTEEVQITDVRWELSPETRAEVERHVAAEAVHVAVERARAYAEALGLESVSPLEMADAGLLLPKADQPPRMLRAMAVDASAPTLALQPADIVVAAAVEARFLAR